MRMGKRALLLLTVVAAMLLALSGVVLAQQPDRTTPDSKQQKANTSTRGQQRADKVRPDHYIVVLKDDADPQQEAQKASGQHGAQVNRVYESAFKGYAGLIPSNRLEEVKAEPNVEFVEQDVEMQAFAPSSKPKGGESTTSSSTTSSTDEVPTGVNRIKATGSTTGTIPKVAVIDTGIQTNHPDLNRVGGVNFVDGNPYRCGTKSGGGNDDNGHGTHVAGTIGAKSGNPEGGVVGVAPGAPLWAIKVLGSNGSGYLSDINCGIDWLAKNAASNGIKVANMSLGGEGNLDNSDRCDPNTGTYTGSDSEHKAICTAVYKGITFAVAAGNSNKDLQGFRPAAYDEVLTVTAMADSDGIAGGGDWRINNACLKSDGTPRIDQEDSSADFSNWTTSGSSDENHTIAAPGVCIKSTWTGSGYNTISGTSMASPHAAGAVARCIANKSCTGKPSDIISKLRSDAAAQPETYGFIADGGHSYAKLLYAGTY